MAKTGHFGKVYSRILEGIEKNSALLFLVLDPPKQSPETAGKIAKLS